MNNYPLGAEYDINAPYNEPLTKSIHVNVEVDISLELNVDVSGDDINHDDLTHIVLKKICELYNIDNTAINNIYIW